MMATYAIHYSRAVKQPQKIGGELRGGYTAHGFALYQALGTRYLVTRKPCNELALYAELMPFGVMNETVAAKMLAEYVVFQERPREAQVDELRAHFNGAIRDLLGGKLPITFGPTMMDTDGDQSAAVRASVVMAALSDVYWVRLLDQPTEKLLAEEAARVTKAMSR
jgi:hypothetical protein